MKEKYDGSTDIEKEVIEECKEAQKEKVDLYKLFLFTVIIIALVGGSIFTANIGCPRHGHKPQRARIQIANFGIGCNSFYLDTKQYPQTLNDLLRNPGLDNWKGPYLDQLSSIPNDSWGKPFFYKNEGLDKFTITSAGKDGIFGTEDDISSDKRND